MITQAEAQLFFNYNKDDGTLTRRVTTNYNAKAGDTVGSLRKDGYLEFRFKGKLFLLHRFIWLYVYGYIPEEDIDHIDHNGANNKLSNLREVSHSFNMKNMKKNINNSSGYTGVSFDKRGKKWESYITVDFKRIFLGYFINKEDAINARVNAEEKYDMHRNHGKDLQC